MKDPCKLSAPFITFDDKTGTVNLYDYRCPLLNHKKCRPDDCPFADDPKFKRTKALLDNMERTLNSKPHARPAAKTESGT